MSYDKCIVSKMQKGAIIFSEKYCVMQIIKLVKLIVFLNTFYE